ncbi:MAG: hypothetical protein ACOX8U_10985 [Bradymonadia bacterium]
MEKSNTCINTDRQCGKNCFDCHTLDYVDKLPNGSLAVSCEVNTGICKIKKCKKGYTLNEDSTVCLDVREYNCCKDKNVFAGKCVNGVCEISLCMPGFHMERENGTIVCAANTQSRCAPADSSALGENTGLIPVHPANCKNAYRYNKDNNLTQSVSTNDVFCNNFGYCQVDSCPKNYHIKRFTIDGEEYIEKYTEESITAYWHEFCVKNTKELCAPQNSYFTVNCSELFKGANKLDCKEGLCTCKTKDDYRSVKIQILESDKEICTPNCADTNTSQLTNARSATCVNNTLTPSLCMPSYRIEGNKCIKNETAKACGSAKVVYKETPKICEHHCSENGMCRINECKPGEHIDLTGRKCVDSNNASCGLPSQYQSVGCKNVVENSQCNNGICDLDIPGSLLNCNGTILDCGNDPKQKVCIINKHNYQCDSGNDYAVERE